MEGEENETVMVPTSSRPVGQDSSFQRELILENWELREQIENLIRKNKNLLGKISEDFRSKLECQRKYDEEKEIWQQKEMRLIKEKVQLLGKLKNSKKDHTELLRHEGKLCGRNCVTCCIRWVCKHKWNINLCCGQLAVLFIWHARASIGEMHLKCEQAMEVLIICQVAEERRDAVYVLPENPIEKLKTIYEIWNSHMRTGEEFLLMGINYTEDIGHAVVCIVDKENKKIIMCDAQSGEKEVRHLDKNEFVQLVNNPNFKGVKLFPVNLEHLRKILKAHFDKLHITGECLGDVYPSFHWAFQPCELGLNEHESE